MLQFPLSFRSRSCISGRWIQRFASAYKSWVSKTGGGSVVMISANAALPGSYDYGEVARSVFIAIAASYAALDLTGRVTAARGRTPMVWLSGGGGVMCIWT